MLNNTSVLHSLVTKDAGGMDSPLDVVDSPLPYPGVEVQMSTDRLFTGLQNYFLYSGNGMFHQRMALRPHRRQATRQTGSSIRTS